MQEKTAGDKLAAMTAGSNRDKALAAKLLAHKFSERLHIYSSVESKPMSTASQKLLISAITQQKDESIKTNLIIALRNFDYGTEVSQKALISLIKSDPSEDIRAAAVKTAAAWLVKTSPTAAEELVAAIGKSLGSDESDDVRLGSAVALKAVKTPTPSAFAALRKAKKDPSAKVSAAAMQTLGNMAAQSPDDNISDIVEELKNKDTVLDGLMAVIKAGPKAKAAEIARTSFSER